MGNKNYAKVLNSNRWNGRIFYQMEQLEKLLSMRTPRMVFIGSMSDPFHPKVPFEYIDQTIGPIELCPQHKFQLLTKRPERALEYFTSNRAERAESINLAIEKFTGGHLAGDDMVEEFCKQKKITRKFRDRLNYNEIIWVHRTWKKPLWPAPHIWIGTSVSTQPDLEKSWQALRDIPTVVKYFSGEPLLERLDFRQCLGWINWVIIGCESGPKRRPCKLEWVEDAIKQCDSAGVPVFVKQLDINGRCSRDINEWPEWARRQEYPKGDKGEK
jgi:protein gp37